MPLLPDARPPEGLRIYAIGDVHGCVDKLTEIYGWIEEDLARHPAIDWRLVHLGDYVDRGPDSNACVEAVMTRVLDRRVYALCGNHEMQFLDFLGQADAETFHNWITYGGTQTMQSYGVELGGEPVYGAFDDLKARAALRENLIGQVPQSHLSFLTTLPYILRFGDFVFVHAGVRPGIDIDDQAPRDLVWIREPFLSSVEDFGAVIVHGHTPQREVIMRPNRIGLDTGAVYGGPLSCLVLEGAERALLEEGGRRLLA